MRTYYIYRQITKLVDSTFSTSYYRWLPFEYVGYAIGTRRLHETFSKNKNKSLWKSISFINTFQYDSKVFAKKETHYSYSIWQFEISPKPMARYVIVDNKGHVRDYYELVKKYTNSKSRNCRIFKGAYQEHYIHNAHDKRNSITPEEIREIKNKYGFTLLPHSRKLDDDYWCWYSCHKKSKSWKDQTKRRKQYRAVRRDENYNKNEYS